jgi:hypothetical protein
LGRFVEHLACNPKPKGFGIPLQIKPTPCKRVKKTTQQQGTHFENGIVPLNEQKGERNLGVWVSLGYGEKE